MMDTSELGAIIVNEDPTTEEWNDPARDIMKIKVRERYGMVLFIEGLAEVGEQLAALVVGIVAGQQRGAGGGRQARMDE
jgi:hypothetical protein